MKIHKILTFIYHLLCPFLLSTVCKSMTLQIEDSFQRVSLHSNLDLVQKYTDFVTDKLIKLFLMQIVDWQKLVVACPSFAFFLRVSFIFANHFYSAKNTFTITTSIGYISAKKPRSLNLRKNQPPKNRSFGKTGPQSPKTLPFVSRHMKDNVKVIRARGSFSCK